MLYPRIYLISLVIIFNLIFIQSAVAQIADSTQSQPRPIISIDDSLTTTANRDTIPDSILFAKDRPDTTQMSLWPAFIRSAIIPGWGQIEQEYPGKAVLIYGLSLTFLYNIAYNYRNPIGV